MRLRAEKTPVTPNGLSHLKILEIVQKFPTLHTYGVGLHCFRKLPEHARMKAIEYSRFMLAFCLDTEIDAAAWFLKVIDPEPALLGGVWVTREYLIFLYQHWRTITYRFPEEVPDGAFLMGALILGKKVKIMGALETSWAIRVKRFKLSEVETTLKRLYDMPEFDGEKYFRS